MKVYINMLYLVCATLAYPGLCATHHPQDFLDSVSGSNQEAEQIVKHFCATCHAPHPMIPLGAPRIGVPSDWQPRLKQGMDILLKHTNEGFGLMPARGGCFECSDQQLRMAIQYMLSHEEVTHPH